MTTWWRKWLSSNFNIEIEHVRKNEHWRNTLYFVFKSDFMAFIENSLWIVETIRMNHEIEVYIYDRLPVKHKDNISKTIVNM